METRDKHGNLNRRSSDRRPVADAAGAKVYLLNLPEPAQVELLDISDSGFSVRFAASPALQMRIPRYLAGYIIADGEKKIYLWGMSRWSTCDARNGRCTYSIGAECRNRLGEAWRDLFTAMDKSGTL